MRAYGTRAGGCVGVLSAGVSGVLLAVTVLVCAQVRTDLRRSQFWIELAQGQLQQVQADLARARSDRAAVLIRGTGVRWRRNSPRSCVRCQRPCDATDYCDHRRLADRAPAGDGCERTLRISSFRARQQRSKRCCTPGMGKRRRGCLLCTALLATYVRGQCRSSGINTRPNRPCSGRSPPSTRS